MGVKLTPQQQAAVIEMGQAFVDAVAAHGERGLPDGHLYAAVMGKMSLAVYQNFINSLIRCGKLRRSNNVLYVVPPQQ
jgi:hypothetical protein